MRGADWLTWSASYHRFHVVIHCDLSVVDEEWHAPVSPQLRSGLIDGSAREFRLNADIATCLHRFSILPV